MELNEEPTKPKCQFLTCSLHVTLVELSADGTSVMSGKLAAVQALLKEEHPWLIYVHCAAHRLNLVLVKALKICVQL